MSNVQSDKIGNVFTVMLVDDDSMQVAYLEALLTALGITNTMSANSGGDAITKLETTNKKPDLLICDLLMPGMDGFDMLSQLAEKKFTMPIIVISSQNQSVRKSAAILATIKSLNFIGELEKPVGLDALKVLLDRAMQA
jgi:CheY-like chemotaxis protein